MDCVDFLLWIFSVDKVDILCEKSFHESVLDRKIFVYQSKVQRIAKEKHSSRSRFIFLCDAPEKPYYPSVYKSASSTWCCKFVFVVKFKHFLWIFVSFLVVWDIQSFFYQQKVILIILHFNISLALDPKNLWIEWHLFLLLNRLVRSFRLVYLTYLISSFSKM